MTLENDSKKTSEDPQASLSDTENVLPFIGKQERIELKVQAALEANPEKEKIEDYFGLNDKPAKISAEEIENSTKLFESLTGAKQGIDNAELLAKISLQAELSETNPEAPSADSLRALLGYGPKKT